MEKNENIGFGNKYCSDLEMRLYAEQLQSILNAKYGIIHIVEEKENEFKHLEFRKNTREWKTIYWIHENKGRILPPNSIRYKIVRGMFRGIKKAIHFIGGKRSEH